MWVILAILLIVVVLLFVYVYPLVTIRAAVKMETTPVSISPPVAKEPIVPKTPVDKFLAKYKYVGHFRDRGARALPVGPFSTKPDLITLVSRFTRVGWPKYVGFQYYVGGVAQVFIGSKNMRYDRYGADPRPPTTVGKLKLGMAWTNAVYQLK